MLLAVLLVVVALGRTSTLENENNLALTIANILLQHFDHPHEATQLDWAAESPESLYRQRDLINRVISNLNGQLAIRFECTHAKIIRPRFYHLLFVDGYGSFREIYIKLHHSRYEFSGYYLIVVSEGAADAVGKTVKKILLDLWKLQVVNVNVVLERSNQTMVYTYFPYRDGRCRVVKPELIYNLASPEWAPGQVVFYWNRFRNFHGCYLEGGTFEAKPYTVYRNVQPDGEFQVKGFEGDLVKLLARKLNFSVHWQNAPGQWGFARELGNSTGLMKMAQEEQVDFAVGCLAMDPDRYRFLKAGVSHYTSKILFAVPRGRPYTPFEKLFRPFQAAVWKMVAILLVLAGFVSVAMSFTTVSVRAFVYGEGINTPFFNALLLFFGGSIPRPPARNFARTLFFLWIMYCFVIGSLYQGSLFKYLQKSMNYPPLRTMEQIDHSGLVYYMVDIGTRFFVNNPTIVKRTIIIPPGKDSLGKKVADLGLRLTDGVVLSPMDLVAYNNRVNPRSRFVNIAREHVSVFPVGIYYSKRSMLKDVFDKQVEKVVPSGLVGYWVQRYGDYDFFAAPSERSEPRKLSNRHLAGSYQLYGCCIAASLAVFLLELASHWFVSLRRLFHHLAQ